MGTSGGLKYELRDGKPFIVRLPEINFIDDQAGNPGLANAGPGWQLRTSLMNLNPIF